jgi:uncharacterized protein
MSPDQARAVGRRVGPGRWFPALVVGGVVTAAAGGGWLYKLRVDGAPAGRTAENLAGLGLVGLGLALLVIGVGAYVLTPAFQGRAAAWRDVGSHRLVLASTALVIALSNLGPILFMLAGTPAGLCSVPGFLSSALSVGVSLLGVTYFRFIRPGVLTADDLGLRPSRLGQDIKTGIFLGIFALVLSALVQLALNGLGVRQTQMQDFQCTRQFPAVGIAAVVLAGAVLAPIAEELFFRGFVFRSYLSMRGPLVAYPLSSLLFATLHLNLPALLPIFVLGLLFAAAYQRTGSIVPSMVGHALFNAIGFAVLFLVDRPA